MKISELTLKHLAYFSLFVQVFTLSIMLSLSIFFRISIVLELFWFLTIFYFFYFFLSINKFYSDRTTYPQSKLKKFLVLLLCFPVLHFFLISGFLIHDTYFSQPREEEADFYKIENQNYVKIDSTVIKNGEANIKDTLAVIIGNDTIKINPQ